jgi:transcription elongation GreA/GreB family factor
MSETRTINVTPTWSGLLPNFLAMLESNNAESRRIGMENLEKIAKLADAYVEMVENQPMVHSDKNSHVINMGDIVDVDESDDNLAFTGRVVGFKKEFVTVEDMEGNAFDIPPTECEVRL